MNFCSSSSPCRPALISRAPDANTVSCVTVYVAETTSRAAHGGTGDVKASANYAISLHTIEEGKKKGCSQVLFLDSNGKRQVEELGGMNVFFVEGEHALHA